MFRFVFQKMILATVKRVGLGGAERGGLRAGAVCPDLCAASSEFLSSHVPDSSG